MQVIRNDYFSLYMKMQQEGMSIKTIMEVTDLSKKEIAKLN